MVLSEGFWAAVKFGLWCEFSCVFHREYRAFGEHRVVPLLFSVRPAKAGISFPAGLIHMDSRLRGE